MLPKSSETRVLHESVVKLFELLERRTVMLRGTFRKDINSEVDLVHLLVVVLLISWANSFTLALELGESLLQVILLLDKSSLDDLSSCEQAFLEVLKCLVLYMDSSFFVELFVLQAEFLKDWQQIILFFLVLLFILDLELVLLHLVASLLIDALFKDLREDILRCRL